MAQITVSRLLPLPLTTLDWPHEPEAGTQTHAGGLTDSSWWGQGGLASAGLHGAMAALPHTCCLTLRQTFTLAVLILYGGLELSTGSSGAMAATYRLQLVSAEHTPGPGAALNPPHPLCHTPCFYDDDSHPHTASQFWKI